MSLTQKIMLSLCSVLLAACATSSPASRIAENPVMYRSLPPEQQALVQQGRICEGMGKDAVFLAWGNPTGNVLRGQNGDKTYERWVYTRQKPVPVTTAGGWYGHPWGPWGPYYGGMDTGYAYVPEETATVTFEKDRVSKWEEASR